MKLTSTLFRVSLLLAVFALMLTGCGDDKSTEPPCYTLAVETVGTGTVELFPDSSCYHAGTNVVITAVPGADWQFDGHEG